MLAWKPTRDLAPREFTNGIVTVAAGLGASVFVARMSGVPALTAGLLYLGAVFLLAAVGAPDWLSQVIRRTPTRGGRPSSEVGARGFLISGALALLAFAAWTVVR